MTETEKNGSVSSASSSGTANAADVINSADIGKDIVRQVEHYFGDYNLPKDRFLREKVKEEDGWVHMDTMIKFKRLSAISTDTKTIMEALKTSDLMEGRPGARAHQEGPRHTLARVGRRQAKEARPADRLPQGIRQGEVHPRRPHRILQRL